MLLLLRRILTTTTTASAKTTNSLLSSSPLQLLLGRRRRQLYHSLFVNPPLTDNSNDPTVKQLTTIDLVEAFARDLGQAREYSPTGLSETIRERQRLMEFLPKSVEELPPRCMEDSFVTAVIPLREMQDIRERYVTYEGNVRIGRVLEDMDIFCVYCAFKHILNPRSVGKKNPYSVVTALVDQIHIASDRIRNEENVRLSGHVSYAGRSSLEVSVVVDQKDTYGVYQKVCEAIFLMVARDPTNTGGALINPLVCKSSEEGGADEERLFLERGTARQKIRKSQELDSLSRKAPTEEEREIIHSMFINQVPNSRLMKESNLKTVFICHPQYRNRYNKIFGGFIMRQACELAFTNTFIYAKRRPHIVHIDDIVFRKPVEIGSILQYTSSVGYVEGNYIHCPVVAEVMSPRTGEYQITNVFQFTFRVDNQPPTVAFHSYREAMVYLESRRHFKKMMANVKK